MSVYPLRWLMVLFLLGGCRFREPEPSPDVYSASVVPGPVRPPLLTKPTAPKDSPASQGGDDLLQRALDRKSDPRGFEASISAYIVAFRPPGEWVRIHKQTGRARGVSGGTCWVRAGRVVHPCAPDETALLKRELRAARVLHGGVLRAGPGLRLERGALVETVQGTELRAQLDPRTAEVTAITMGSPPSPVLREVIDAKRSSPPAASHFAADQVKAGLRERVVHPERHLLCADHLGDLDGVGGVVQRLTDQVRALRLRGDRLGGILAHQRAASRWRICLPFRSRTDALSRRVGTFDGGAGSVVDPPHTVARLWHRGPYAALMGQRAALEAWIGASGWKLAPGARPRATLYLDPSVSAPADLVSSIDLPLAPE